MKRNIFHIVLSLLCFFPFVPYAQALSYTWNGTSTDWAAASNWSPNGIPGPNDHVTFNGTALQYPTLSANRTVADFTMSGGVLNLGGFRLTATGFTQVTGGQINNGVADFHGARTTLQGAVFGAEVVVVSGEVWLNGATYNNHCYFERTGTITVTPSGTGNQYNSDVEFVNSGTGQFRPQYFYADTFNGNIKMSNLNAAGGIFYRHDFAFPSPSLLANGKTISIGSAGFPNGSLNIGNLHQIGSMPQSLTFLGNVGLHLKYVTFDGPVNLTSNLVTLESSVFNSLSKFTQTGTNISNYSAGGNIFNQDVEFTNTGTGSFGLATVHKDNFLGDVILNNTSSGDILIGLNDPTRMTFAIGKSIRIGNQGFAHGRLRLRHFSGLDASSWQVLLPSTAGLSMIDVRFSGNIHISGPSMSYESCIFDRRAELSGQTLTIDRCVFHDPCVLTQDGNGVFEYSNGGNTFDSEVEFRNTSSGSFRLALWNADRFKGNVVINATNGGSITFGENTGFVEFIGSVPQNISGMGKPQFRKLINSNTMGKLAVHNEIIVRETLDLATGGLEIFSKDLTLWTNAIIQHQTPQKYIQTIGSGALVRGIPANGYNTPILFPVGDATTYSPYTATFTAGTIPQNATLAVRVLHADEPHLICKSNYTQRFWNVKGHGISNFQFNATAQYAQSDIVGDESQMHPINWNALDGLNQPTGSINTLTNQIFFQNVDSFGNFTADRCIEPFLDPAFSTTASECAPGYFFFHSASESGTHSWDFGDGQTSHLIHPAHDFPRTQALDTFIVRHIVSNCCITDTAYDTIIVRLRQPTPQGATAHLLEIHMTTPTALEVCANPKLYTTQIINRSSQAVTHLFFNPQLPWGVKYEPNTVTGMTEFETLLQNQPLFYRDSLRAHDTLMVTFQAAACCAINLLTAQGGLIINRPVVQYDGGYDTTSTSSYNVNSPAIAISGANISPLVGSGQVGNIITRTISITNTGNGEVGELYITDTHSQALALNHVSYGTLTSNGLIDTIHLTASDFHHYGFPSGTLKRDSTIVITETLEIICSSVPNVASTIRVSWGCMDGGCNQNDPSATVNANITINPAGGPNIVFQDINRDTCYGASVTVPRELRIRNIGTSTAFSPILVLGRYDLRSLTGIFNGYFSLTDAHGSTYAIVPDSIAPMDTLHQRCHQDTSGALYFVLPNIHVGETVILHYFTVTDAPNPQSCNAPQTREGWLYELSYVDLCSPLVRTTRTGRAGPQQTATMTQSVESPADITQGDTTTLAYTNEAISLWNGDNTQKLRVQFVIEPGLRYAANSFYLLLTNGVVVQPSSLTITGPNNGFATTTLTAEFGSTGQPIYNAPAFLRSEFRLDVIAVCPAPPTGIVHQNISYVPSMQCSNPISIPLSCLTLEINIHCPGCRTQGIHSLAFGWKRINVGEPDNDNNGVADSGGTLDLQRIKLQRATLGDTLEGRLVTDVEITPDYNPWPLTMPFLFGYYEISLDQQQRFTTLGVNVSLYDVLHDTTYDFFMPPSHAEHNIQFWRYDYSIDTMHHYGWVPSTYSQFSNGDRILFKPLVKVTGNIGTNLIRQIETNNWVYLGLRAQPTCDASTCLPANGMVQLCGYTAPRCDTTVRYYCTQYGGRFNLVGEQSGAQFPASSPTDQTCVQVVPMSVSQSIWGGVGANFFPFEHRNFSYSDTLSFTMPSQFSFDHATLTMQRTAGNGVATESRNVMPDRVNGNAFIFYTNRHFTADPAFAGPSDSLLYLPDESFTCYLNIYLGSSCNTTPNISFPYYGTAGLQRVPSLRTGISPPLATSFNGIGTVRFNDPNIALSSPLATRDGVESETCWDVTVSNTDVYADKVWIAAVSGSGNITVTSMTSNGIPLPQVNGIFQLGGVANGQPSNIRVCATYRCTPNLDPETVQIRAGWSCDAYPVSLLQLPCPPAAFLTLTLQPKQAGLQATIQAPTNVELCTAIPVELEVNATGVGTMHDPTVRFTLPPASGLYFAQGSGRLQLLTPSGAQMVIPDPVHVSGTTYQWNINALNNYFATHNMHGGERFKINFQLLTNCDFIAGQPVLCTVNGTTNCGEIKTLNFQTNPFGIVGFPAYTSTSMQLRMNDFPACDTVETMRVSIRNTGNLLTGATDSVFVFLPTGLQYAAAFIAVRNAPLNSTPRLENLGYGVRYGWKVPQGVASGDSIVFQVDIARNSSFACGPFSIYGTMVVTDAVQCASTGSPCAVGMASSTHVLTRQAVQPSAAFSLPATLCMGGTLNLSSAATAPCITHFWDFGDGTTSTAASPSHTYDNIPDGFYTITHSISPCGITVSHTIQVYTCCTNFISGISKTDVSCYGGGDGAAVVNLVGGNAPFVSHWSNLASTQSISGLVPGTYTVTVTDRRNCVRTATQTIVQPAILSANVSGGIISCHGGMAQVTVSATGGRTPYQGIGTFTVGPGIHTFVVTDGSGCTASRAITVVDPPVLVAHASATAAPCSGGTAMVTVTSSGGTLPISGVGTFQATAGTHTYVVTDAKGCTAYTTITVISTIPPTVTATATTVSCPSGSDGTATAVATSGTPPYSYNWNTIPPQSTPTATALTSGPYTVVVTDANSCTASTTITISEPAPLTVSVSAGTIGCNGGTATVTVTANGGTAPYSGTGTFATGLGQQSYIVTDARGCVATATINIVQSTPPSVAVNLTGASCYPVNNGAATAIVTGGIPPFTYNWSTTPPRSSATITGLSVGNYTVTVTDAVGCSASRTVTLSLIPCPNFRTETQSSWGAPLPGNSTVSYLYANFGTVFPNGLTVGCTKTLRLTSAAAVTDFLPSTGTAAALPSSVVNPTNYGNSLAGQVVALKLNIGFDDANPNFAPPTATLKQLMILSGTFNNWTVGQLLATAEKVLGGCYSPYSITAITNALTLVNQKYEYGTANGGYLFCPCTCAPKTIPETPNSEPESAEGMVTLMAYPNPTLGMLDVVVTCASCDQEKQYSLSLTDLSGKVLQEKPILVIDGQARLRLTLSEYAAATYLLSLEGNGISRMVHRVVKE